MVSSIAQIGRFFSNSKIVNFFKGKPKISLSYIKSTGRKRLASQADVFGSQRNKLAHVDRYTEPIDAIGSKGTVLRHTSIHTRKYVPEDGTKLANLGVKHVETTQTPYGKSVHAFVELPNGKTKMLLNAEDIRNYIKLMS